MIEKDIDLTKKRDGHEKSMMYITKSMMDITKKRDGMTKSMMNNIKSMMDNITKSMMDMT